MTPLREKRVPAQVDAFKINYATLGGRKVFGWYARPKAPGKYPAHIRYPSSGIYPLPRSGNVQQTMQLVDSDSRFRR